MSPTGSDDLGDLHMLVSTLIESGSSSDSATGEVGLQVATRRVAIAVELKMLADQALHDSVGQARAQEVSWQQIGEVRHRRAPHAVGLPESDCRRTATQVQCSVFAQPRRRRTLRVLAIWDRGLGVRPQ